MTFRQFYKYRAVWMGIAILWVISYHIPIEHHSLILKNIILFAPTAVDIFVFASGLGCAFSYKRSASVLDFIKKRMVRVYPCYVLLMLFWIPAYCCVKGMMPFKSIIGNLCGLEYYAYTQYSFNWYFPFIVVLYIFTPFFVELVDRFKDTKSFLIVLLVTLVVSITFHRYYYYLIMVSRIPIYLIGIYFALHFEQDQKVSRKQGVLFVFLILLGAAFLKFILTHHPELLTSYGLYWYSSILIVPGLCYLISLCCGMISRSRLKIAEKIVDLFFRVGGITLELYCVHLFFMDLYNHYFKTPDNLSVFVTIVLSVAASILLNKAATQVQKRLLRISKNAG